MSTHQHMTTTFETQHIPTPVKLAAAWTSFMFLYVYVDVLNFYKPGVLDSIQNGMVWTFEVSPTLLTIFLVSIAIPAVMVTLSITLPSRLNRMTNVVVASLYIPYSLFNAVGETWEWTFFYGLSIGIEIVLLAFIVRCAWTWPRTTSPLNTTSGADHAAAGINERD